MHGTTHAMRLGPLTPLYPCKSTPEGRRILRQRFPHKYDTKIQLVLLSFYFLMTLIWLWVWYSKRREARREERQLPLWREKERQEERDQASRWERNVDLATSTGSSVRGSRIQSFDLASMQQLARTIDQYRSDSRGLPSKFKPRGYRPSDEERLSRRLVLCRVESGRDRERCSCYPGICDKCCRWVEKDDVLDVESLNIWKAL